MIVDLFAGAGGWDIAARELGLDPLGIEWDDAACATRSAAGLRTLQADVAALDPNPYAGCTGLLASPPCQGFSMAGKGKGRLDGARIRRAAIQLAHGRDHRNAYRWSDDRSALVLEPLRWAFALRPDWLAFEQVPAVLPVWELYAKLLQARGYSAWAGYLQAEQFGVPQTRKRAFLIASRVGGVAAPVPTHSRYHARTPERLDDGVLPWVSMAEALGWEGDLVALRSNYGTGGDASKRGQRLASQPAPTVTSKADRMQWRLRGKHSVAGVGRAERTIDTPALTVGSGARSWPFTRPATTVNCDPRISRPGWHDPSISGSQQAGSIRVTAQEASVLQSFPVDHPWQGTKTKQFEQIGNAVPPALATPVLKAAMAAPVEAVAKATASLGDKAAA